jgi:RNA polymerase sigma-70 factor, ECF subfamily
MWLAEKELSASEAPSLLRDARAGDLRAFEILLEPLLEPAYRLAVVMLQDRTEAEDVLQEAAFRAWKSIRSFRQDRPSLKPWFLTIVANQCRQTRRAKWWSVQGGLAQMQGGLARMRGSPELEDMVLQRHELARAIAQLAREDRVALHLYFALDMPVDQVARVLGVSPRGAKSRIHRTLRRLRLKLEDEEILSR